MSFNYPTPTCKVRGFTLMELMITVAIIALLTTVAYASYKSSVLRAHRTEAKSALLDIAGREERLYSTTNTYSNDPKDVGYSGTASQPFTVGNGYYTVTISNVTGTTFKLEADAQGSQTDDTQCLKFTVDQTGAEDATDPVCWQK